VSETTLLRNNAIVRHASVGATPPHGPVKTGELPLVQVKTAPGGPQIQEGQQKPVAIVPSKEGRGAVVTGALPMVHIKMTQNGAQPDDGRDSPVLIKDNRQTIAAGNLPMVQVRMDGGKPQVQTVPNVQAGPPQIPSASPALSAPRVAQSLGNQRVARIAAPRPALPAPVLPPVPELTTDQLMLCRHVVDKYLAELLAAAPAEEDAPVEHSEAAKLAMATIDTIDQALVAVAVRAEAAALAASAPPVAPAPVSNAYVNPRPTTGGHFSPAALAPTVPRDTGYVARTPGTRTGNSSMAPRRVQRSAQPGQPLPPVVVKMDGNRPVLQQTPPVDPVTQASALTPDSDAQG